MIDLTLGTTTPGNPANTGNWMVQFPRPTPSPLAPISLMAWRAAEVEFARWIQPGFPEFPWILSEEGREEALRRQRLAPASGQRLCKLTQRDDEVARDAKMWCFSDAAWCLLLGSLRSQGLRVSGAVNYGPRVEIDELLLSHLFVDLEHDVATSVDGTTTWRALAAGWPMPQVAVDRIVPPAVPPQLDAAATLQGEFVKWYRTTYPAGHPIGKKQDELAFEAARSLGRQVSGRTVRRALRDFRGRPKAAR